MMRTMLRTMLRAAAVLSVTLCGVATTPVHAGLLTGIVEAAGPYGLPLPGFNITFPAPNNDNVAGVSPNTLVTTGPLITNGIGPIDFVLEVTNTGDTGTGTTTTEYSINFAEVLNNTGVTWVGYEFSLGTGTGAGFQRLGGSIPGLDSDAPHYDLEPSTDVFALQIWEPDRILFSGGGVLAPGGTGLASAFSLDVPDFGEPGGTYQFTIRCESIVPEPTALVLALFGSLACGCVVWRQRRRN